MLGRKRGVHYKFGVQVPNDYNHAVELDSQNKNKEWDASVDTEVNKILEYETFKDWGMRPPPKDYKKITAHIVFDVKYDGRKRARLVGGGHLTEPTDDVSYSGIALLQVI